MPDMLRLDMIGHSRLFVGIKTAFHTLIGLWPGFANSGIYQSIKISKRT